MFIDVEAVLVMPVWKWGIYPSTCEKRFTQKRDVDKIGGIESWRYMLHGCQSEITDEGLVVTLLLAQVNEERLPLPLIDFQQERLVIPNTVGVREVLSLRVSIMPSHAEMRQLAQRMVHVGWTQK